MQHTTEVTARIVGENIEILRTWRGLKKYELGRLVGDVPQRVSQVISGNFSPQLLTLNK
jgi:hypothetical protein